MFVGESHKKVPVELSQALQPFGPNACYTLITGNGPNALDFHIAFYIGRPSPHEILSAAAGQLEGGTA